MDVWCFWFMLPLTLMTNHWGRMHNEMGIATKTILQTLGLNTHRNGINLEKEMDFIRASYSHYH